MGKLDNLWFMNESPDYEREEWLLKGYLRDSRDARLRGELEPFYSDIKRKITDIESFLVSRRLAKSTGVTDDEQRRLDEFVERGDDSPEGIEVFEIIKNAHKELNEEKKRYGNIWSQVEDSFNVYYLGSPPSLHSTHGILMIRYYGSPVTEVYRFEKKKFRISFILLEYSDGEYEHLREKYGAEDVFVIAEADMSFNTEKTALPFLRHHLGTALI